MKHLFLWCLLAIACTPRPQPEVMAEPELDNKTEKQVPEEISCRYGTLEQQATSVYLLALVPQKEGYRSAILQKGVDEALFGNQSILERADRTYLRSFLMRTGSSDITSECYIPRHGIAYYNHKEELIAYLEICFECRRLEAFGDFPMPDGDYFDHFDALKRLFVKHHLISNPE